MPLPKPHASSCPKGCGQRTVKRMEAYTSDDATALHSFDVTTGLIRASLGLEGGWEMGAVRNRQVARGHRAVSESDKTTWTKADVFKTTIAMVDAEAGKTTRTITLDGNFDIDALDSAGSNST